MTERNDASNPDATGAATDTDTEQLAETIQELRTSIDWLLDDMSAVRDRITANTQRIEQVEARLDAVQGRNAKRKKPAPKPWGSNSPEEEKCLAYIVANVPRCRTPSELSELLRQMAEADMPCPDKKGWGSGPRAVGIIRQLAERCRFNMPRSFRV
jgi:outer membrane murein-binding lipoprotein Lpp